MIKKIGLTMAVTAAISSLTGCSMMDTVIEHKDLKVATKMSDTIFLDPVAPNNKIVYVDYHNTSDEKSLDLKPELIGTLKSRGWKITNNPKKAYGMLQVNVLQAGKNTDSNIKNMLANGFGGAVLGAGIGSAVSGGSGAVSGGLIGSAASAIGGMFVKDVTYTLTTDIQVSIRPSSGEKVKQTTLSHLKQGSSTYTLQKGQGEAKWIRYRTRVIAYADQMNLTFEKAAPVLEKQMGHSIGNIF